jgi:predicted ribosomally synthesized peptide with SipW-like signal peptide
MVAMSELHPKHPANGADKRHKSTEVQEMAADDRTRRGAGIRLALSLIVLALIGLVVGTSTLSAFSAITQNPGNTFSTGSVDLEDDDDRRLRQRHADAFRGKAGRHR